VILKNELGIQLDTPQPDKILVSVEDRNMPGKTYVFEFEAIPNFYDEWSEQNMDSIFANSNVVLREFDNGVLTAIYPDKYRVQTVAKEKNLLGQELSDRLFANSFAAQLAERAIR